MSAGYPVRWSASSPSVRLNAGAAPPGEEHDQRDERQHEEDGVNDHTAGDGDDEQDDGESQQHGRVPSLWGVFPAGINYPRTPGANHMCVGGWFTAGR